MSSSRAPRDVETSVGVPGGGRDCGGKTRMCSIFGGSTKLIEQRDFVPARQARGGNLYCMAMLRRYACADFEHLDGSKDTRLTISTSKHPLFKHSKAFTINSLTRPQRAVEFFKRKTSKVSNYSARARTPAAGKSSPHS